MTTRTPFPNNEQSLGSRKTRRQIGFSSTAHFTTTAKYSVLQERASCGISRFAIIYFFPLFVLSVCLRVFLVRTRQELHGALAMPMRPASGIAIHPPPLGFRHSHSSSSNGVIKKKSTHSTKPSPRVYHQCTALPFLGSVGCSEGKRSKEEKGTGKPKGRSVSGEGHSLFGSSRKSRIFAFTSLVPTKKGLGTAHGQSKCVMP